MKKHSIILFLVITNIYSFSPAQNTLKFKVEDLAITAAWDFASESCPEGVKGYKILNLSAIKIVDGAVF